MNKWITLEEARTRFSDLQALGEVLGHNPNWIDPDFNIHGTRVGFFGGEGHFISAHWLDYQDTYIMVPDIESYEALDLSKVNPTLIFIIPSPIDDEKP